MGVLSVVVGSKGMGQHGHVCTTYMSIGMWGVPTRLWDLAQHVCGVPTLVGVGTCLGAAIGGGGAAALQQQEWR